MAGITCAAFEHRHDLSFAQVQEVQGLGPTSDGTQALDCLMAGKVGVRQLV